ncbi:MAG: FAD-dependent oxidoreductase [Proteobacteria bacterium]|nr:FAD-dependent oxidoreductase [Pseudomonadota bacterium]
MLIPEDMRSWWGWGRTDVVPPSAEGLMAFLRRHISPWPAPRGPIPTLDSIILRPADMPPELTAALVRIVGTGNVRADRRTRVLHAVGRGYRDLIRLRLGQVPSPPDAVVYPENHEQVLGILDVARTFQAAVVPFGGGSSVVGGVELPETVRPNICLDLTRMNRLLSLSPRNLTARFQAGIAGPDLEAALNRDGFTLGHFPQSFEFSTLGGWIATRGAGQKSARYGKIEDMVLSLRAAFPGGELNTPATPAAAAGGDLAALLIGSEGSLAVITEAEVKIRPLPEAEWFDSWLFPVFEAGLEAVRKLAATGEPPATLRLSDLLETQALFSEAARQKTSSAQRFFFEQIVPRYLGWRGLFLDKACLALAGGEGSPRQIRRERREAGRIFRAHGGVRVGSAPARTWHETRYTSPYLRDVMIDGGLLIETLETACLWESLPDLYARVGKVLRDALDWEGATGLVMAHLSHVYPEGGNLYFTFFAPRIEGHEEAQWLRAKQAATRTIVENGGALSHHHGVGRDHKPWFDRYWGRDLADLFRSAKTRLDPQGLLNPGVITDPDLNALAPLEATRPFSPALRGSNLEAFQGSLYDLLVVGGGIVGAGVAWDASLRGLSVALIEKDDFGSGTSGKSSRMIHGGLRYLKSGDFRLVRESLGERRNLMRIAPHLVKGIPFVFPIYKDQGDSRTVINLGLWGYDTLAGSKKNLPPHESLTAEQTLEMEPRLIREGLEGGLVYYDGLTDDARLTLETVKAATRYGAATANHVELIGMEVLPDRMTARVLDRITSKTWEVSARAVVNATGVWSDRIRIVVQPDARALLRPAKGIHIVFPRKLKPISQVIILKGADDRPLFAVPSGDMVYVGTTDQDYRGNLDEVHAEPDEVEYLVDAVNRSITGPPLTRDQVAIAWAGVRPLVASGKSGQTKDISREHDIRVEADRLVTVSGGKLTTFRIMAAQTVDHVCQILKKTDLPPAPTDLLHLGQPRAVPEKQDPDRLPGRAVERLRDKYGPQTENILLLARSPLLASTLDTETGLTAAEVCWSVQGEMAMTLTDAMVRRLGLTYTTPDGGRESAPKVARIMAGILGWDEEEFRKQLAAYQELLERETAFLRG